ncbi:hypothetical protein [Methanosarcina barkeri]|uniref:hypothetical protein n=1 Tax=Methanosarcina barkeri TaxID=2208 RepID=UPI000A8EC6E8|nr:hypothetical protein [Methanosarcina barkeri]
MTANKCEFYPDVYEVIKTLREVNDSSEKVSIQRIENKLLPAKKKTTKEIYQPEKEEKNPSLSKIES